MTRKLQQPLMEDTKSRKRILKPAVEKRRRDRINKSLAELRTLLLNYTADPRLQNPKIEKAEILDLAVEHLHKWTDGKNKSNDAPNGVVSLHQSSAPAHLTIESAGFQQCMAQMASYMQKISPAQRTSLIEGLKYHTEKQQPNNTSPGQNTLAAAVDVVCTSESKEETCKSLSRTHSPLQPHTCSTPYHDILSPPTSPWFSPSFSTYASSPPFPSFACHFSFPPSLSPPSPNTSFSLHTLPAPVSFSPTVAHPGPVAFHCSPISSLRSPPHPVQREGSSSTSFTWRPWF